MAGGTKSAKGPKGASGSGRTTPKGTQPAKGGSSRAANGAKATRAADGAKGARRRGGRNPEPEKASPHHRQPGHRRKGTRYTPPVPKSTKRSPRWMAVLMIALFLVGVVVIILNYADLLPGGVNNWWLVGAIGAIFGGLIVATTYR